jgi:hypothetical protein
MAFNVYHNPQSVSIGSTSITGVVSITVAQSFQEIHAAADADAFESVARLTTGRTSGTITLVDPVQAQAVAGATGTLTFTWTNVKGTTNKTVTIANCSIGGWDGTVGRDAASSAKLAFIAGKDDGTNPVSVA